MDNDVSMNVANQSSTPSPKKSGVLKWTLVFAIAIVINLFLLYAVQVAYPQPEYEKYCPESQVIRSIETQNECVEVGGQWNPNTQMKNSPMGAPDMAVPAGYCDQTFTCQNQFEDAMKIYDRNVFIVFVIAGIILLVASVYVIGVSAVSLGLSFGGVLALVIGAMSYWSNMNDILRVIILGIALSALIWVAYKKFKD